MVLTGEGEVHAILDILPDEFILKSVVLGFVSKEISRAEHEYLYSPPPPTLGKLYIVKAYGSWNLKIFMIPADLKRHTP